MAMPRHDQLLSGPVKSSGEYCRAGAFTFSVPAEAGFGVEADPNPPRLMGAPFAADLHASHCYAILPGGQVEPPERCCNGDFFTDVALVIVPFHQLCEGPSRLHAALASSCTLMAGYNKQSDMPALLHEAARAVRCEWMDCK